MRELCIYDKYCYSLPLPVYKQCIWILRDVDRLTELAGAGYDAPDVQLAKMRVNAYNAAIELVPSEYRGGIMRNIIEGEAFDASASLNTWKRWKKTLVYTLARNLSLY